MATVNEDEEQNELLTLQYIVLDHPSQTVTAVLAEACVAVAGEVNEVPRVVDDEVIDELRLPWLLRSHRQSLACGEHIDERRLPHIGSPDEGVFGEACRRAFLHATIADDELCRLNDHRLLLCLSKWLQRYG